MEWTEQDQKEWEDFCSIVNKDAINSLWGLKCEGWRAAPSTDNPNHPPEFTLSANGVGSVLFKLHRAGFKVVRNDQK